MFYYVVDWEEPSPKSRWASWAYLSRKWDTSTSTSTVIRSSVICKQTFLTLEARSTVIKCFPVIREVSSSQIGCYTREFQHQGWFNCFTSDFRALGAIKGYIKVLWSIWLSRVKSILESSNIRAAILIVSPLSLEARVLLNVVF